MRSPIPCFACVAALVAAPLLVSAQPSRLDATTARLTLLTGPGPISEAGGRKLTPQGWVMTPMPMFSDSKKMVETVDTSIPAVERIAELELQAAEAKLKEAKAKLERLRAERAAMEEQRRQMDARIKALQPAPGK